MFTEWKWGTGLGVLLGLVLTLVFSVETTHAQEQVRTSFTTICEATAGSSATLDGRMGSQTHVGAVDFDDEHHPTCVGTGFVIEPATAVDVNATVLLLDGFTEAWAAPIFLGYANVGISLKLSVHLGNAAGRVLCTDELVLDEKSTPAGYTSGSLVSTHYLLSCHAELEPPLTGTTIFTQVWLDTWGTAGAFAGANAQAHVDVVSLGIVPYCEEVMVEASEGTVPLFSWYSQGRNDVFVTTHPEWAGCRGKRTHGDEYGFVRLEGFVFDPDLPQPYGTVPLVSWWSWNHMDNFTTTDPLWQGMIGTVNAEGYELFRVEGYIFDPALGGPVGTIPLWSFKSEDRSDQFVTTNTFWRSELADRRTALGDTRPPNYGDYGISRFEGLVYDPAVQPPDHPVMPSIPDDLLPYVVPRDPLPFPLPGDLVPDFD